MIAPSKRDLFPSGDVSHMFIHDRALQCSSQPTQAEGGDLIVYTVQSDEQSRCAGFSCPIVSVQILCQEAFKFSSIGSGCIRVLAHMLLSATAANTSAKCF